MKGRSNPTIALLGMLFGCALADAQTSPPYTTIDFPGATSTSAWAINNKGDVAGVYSLPNGTSHGFLLSGGHLSSIDFPGASNTRTFGINDQGDLVGDYYNTSGFTHGFVLTKGRFVTVDVPGAGADALAGINNHGAIIAAYNVVANDGIAHTAIIEGGMIRKYDYPAAALTLGNGINDAGDIVGNYQISGVSHGFVLSNGKTTTIDFPSATFTGTYGISASGDLVGRYTLNGVTHGYVYSGGKFTPIDIPGSTATAVSALNSVGDIVGRYTSNGISHAFVMNSPAASYTITDLGTLPGGSFSQAVQGNTDNGLIAGLSGTAGGDTHAVLWQFGQTIDLATPAFGGPNSAAVGLNSWGAVVGQAETAEHDEEDFCGDGSGFRCVPFVWQNGIMSQLPTLGGPNGVVDTVNNSGLIVGIAQTAASDSSCLPPRTHPYQGVVWGPTPGQIRVLRPLPGDTVSLPFWINDSGQAVGASGLCSNTVVTGVLAGAHAVLWDSDGTPFDLGSLGGTVDPSLFAVGNRGTYINNRGEVVGGSALEGNKTGHAFLWTRDAGMKDLGVLPGDFNTGAIAINDRGEVVGASNDDKGNSRAFIWRNGIMTDLNSLAPADSPLYLLVAAGINDRGEIVGWGATKSGDVHAFLATPNNVPYGIVARGVQRPEVSSEAKSKNLIHQIGKRIPAWMR